MSSQDGKIDYVDPRNGYGYYADNPTRPHWAVPVDRSLEEAILSGEPFDGPRWTEEEK